MVKCMTKSGYLTYLIKLLCVFHQIAKSLNKTKKIYLNALLKIICQTILICFGFLLFQVQASILTLSMLVVTFV